MSPFKSLDYESPSSFEDHVDDDSAIVDLLYPSMDEGLESNNVEIIGSCNGLICLLLCDTNKISLWNPSTRVSRDLPSLTCNFHNDCPIFNGFGYDSINDTYKVVRGTLDGIVDVFSTSGERWRRIQGFKDISIFDEEQGIFFNGTLHWLGYNVINETKKEKTIVTLDLGQETFGVMKQPILEHDENVNFHNVDVLQGCLSLLNKAYCVVATESAGREIPLAFLDRVKNDFSKKYAGGKAATASAKSLNREFGSKLKEHMKYCCDHPEEISKLSKVKAQVSEVKGVMMENIEKVLDRGEKIELLVDKTDNLRSQTYVYVPCQKYCIQLNQMVIGSIRLCGPVVDVKLTNQSECFPYNWSLAHEELDWLVF
uniref:Vesicle-associated membrane protein 725 n=1 Tax=Solanum tuberosum TaxID=4113 RepID=M1BEN0_SOLTU